MSTVVEQLAEENKKFLDKIDGKTERDVSVPFNLPPSGMMPDGKAPWWQYAPKTFKDFSGWVVWRVWPGGRKVFRGWLDENIAQEIASWCRDHCPDEEVGADVNYLAGTLKDGPAPVVCG